MEAVTAHLAAYWIPYVVALAVLVPVIYFTRRWSVPAIQWGGELAIYFAVFHVVVHYVVRMLSWLKSEMGMYEDDRVDPGWMTPILEAWDRSQYKPVGVFYFECAMLLVFLLLMIRIRRFRVQKIKPRTERIARGEVPKSLRERYSRPQNAPQDRR